jgi:thiol-disulfide isomerase/thioredoxin
MKKDNQLLLYVVLGVMGVVLFVGYKTKVAKEQINIPILKQIQDFMGGVDAVEDAPNCPNGVCPPNLPNEPSQPIVGPPNSPFNPPGRTPPTGWDETDYSYTKALELAKERDQNVFVVFHATWCGPCKKLKSETLDNAKVIEALHPFVRARVDVDQDRASTSKYNIRGVPAYFILDKNGKVLKSGSGHKSVQSFLEWLGSYKNVQQAKFLVGNPLDS